MTRTSDYEYVQSETNKYDPVSRIPSCHFDVVCLKQNAMNCVLTAIRRGEIIGYTYEKKNENKP